MRMGACIPALGCVEEHTLGHRGPAVLTTPLVPKNVGGVAVCGCCCSYCCCDPKHVGVVAVCG